MNATTVKHCGILEYLSTTDYYTVNDQCIDEIDANSIKKIIIGVKLDSENETIISKFNPSVKFIFTKLSHIELCAEYVDEIKYLKIS
jgi:hypothetical protein